MKVETVDAYIAGFNPAIQERLIQIRTLIRSCLPATASEKISYAMPTFYLGTNIIHFAAFKNHIGLYPLPETLRTLNSELSAFPQGKGSIQFVHSQPLPLEIIKKIVLCRMAELKAKKG